MNRRAARQLAFLTRTDSYPQPTAAVERIETHMSWLFLTDLHVYKLKKPLRHGRSDYRSLAARRLGCRRELRLNRRFAPDVYLAALPLTIDASGKLAIGGRGRCIDWLLKMRRLPATQAFDRRLRSGRVRPADVARIGTFFAAFVRATPAARITALGYRRQLQREIARAEADLLRPEFGLDHARIDALVQALLSCTRLYATQMDARTWRVIDGHGDLRPEHIYLTDPPTLIDCIEFDPRLRRRDPLAELAFLAMEADRLGYPEVDRWLFIAYRRASLDPAPRALIDYYKALNALVRARIAILHLEDPALASRRRWLRRSNDYLRLAQKYLTLARRRGELRLRHAPRSAEARSAR